MYPDQTWKRVIQHTNVKLTAYNDTKIPCIGKIDLVCSHNQSRWSTHTFYVVDVPGPAVAGLPTCEQLKLVTINAAAKPATKCQRKSATFSAIAVSSVQELKDRYPQQFDRIGNLKRRAKLHLIDNATPSIDAPRKCSVHVKEKLKAELQKMEEMGIIRRITHHTNWCSSLTTTVKSDGSFRVCQDPKRLNENLKRCPHKVPTLEEINPQLAKAKFFSKLDAKVGYWEITLDDESQELTTFRTVFGRWCFRKLPFGLSVSQDIFQQEMDRITEQVEGCVSIADDLIVFGTTEEEHDRNLMKLMEVAKCEGLAFNSSKCTIKKSSINFFGALYTANGIKPDPKKIEDLKAMPTPQNKDELERFMGLSHTWQIIFHSMRLRLALWEIFRRVKLLLFGRKTINKFLKIWSSRYRQKPACLTLTLQSQRHWKSMRSRRDLALACYREKGRWHLHPNPYQLLKATIPTLKERHRHWYLVW